MWKEDVKYNGLHTWVERQLGRPECCSKCKEVGKVDLANISGEYKRDLTDWEWLCRKCHMIKDGRMNALILNNKNKRMYGNAACSTCGSQFVKKNNKSAFCSRSCYYTFQRTNPELIKNQHSKP